MCACLCENLCPCEALRGLEALFAAAARGKAAGSDGIPDDVFALLSVQMVRLFHPLFVNMAIRVCEPLSLQGGRLHELLKKKRGQEPGQWGTGARQPVTLRA